MTFVAPERFNIADYFLGDRLAEGLGDRRALIVDDGQGGTREWTYREVASLAARFANALGDLGVEPEQRVVVSLPDGAHFAGALFGTLASGAVVVMVNPGLPEEDLAQLLDYVRPKAAVVGAGNGAAYLETQAGTGWPRKVLSVDVDLPGATRFDENAPGADSFEHYPTHRDDPAIWLFSGGTTGRPKAVVQSHSSFANTTELYAKAALGYEADDITLSIPKLYFGYATGSNLLFPFAVGATAVLFPEKPTAEVLYEKISRHRPTVLINVPTMINHMVSHPDAEQQDLSCLRFATSAGEALPVPLYERWKELFGVELLDGLGTAEMWHVFLTNLPGDVTPGTLGRVVPGFELRVCDDEGRDVPDGEVGRMWVRGDSLALGYWQERAKTADAFRGEWFVGGDLISRAPDGTVTYRGRGDDVMKVGGRWLVPGEVENCLLTHPRVKECAVIGVPNAEGLTKPYAFVIAKGEVGDDLAEELKNHALAELEPYKHPREVRFLDDFPRTHLGKVDRGKLRQTIVANPPPPN